MFFSIGVPSSILYSSLVLSLVMVVGDLINRIKNKLDYSLWVLLI